jgi:tetratricopeptide (TPR) repeat protein
MAEWSKAPDSKSGLGQPNGGSNPSLSASTLLLACWTALVVPLQAMGQSGDADAAFQRGIDLQQVGRFTEAIKAYDEAIRLGSSYLVAYNNRGAAYGALKQYERAIPDFDRAIELNPKYAEAYCNRGAAFGALKQYERAIRDFDKAIQLDPNYARAYNNLAWLLATAENPSIRDGRRAVELALKACDLSACRDAYLLDTLAAAYARVGNFAKAIEWHNKAMASPQHAIDSETEARLRSYREGKAWPAD